MILINTRDEIGREISIEKFTWRLLVWNMKNGNWTLGCKTNVIDVCLKYVLILKLDKKNRRKLIEDSKENREEMTQRQL